MEESIKIPKGEEKTFFSLQGKDYSPLVLAYIGDAVYEVYVRSKLMEAGNLPVNKIHHAATKYVSAEAQYLIYHSIKDMLTEEEEAVFKRGRNAKSATVPKNANPVHYRFATGFEALVGFLYVNAMHERLCEILDNSFSRRKEEISG